jgi:hypothetical protein
MLSSMRYTLEVGLVCPTIFCVYDFNPLLTFTNHYEGSPQDVINLFV